MKNRVVVAAVLVLAVLLSASAAFASACYVSQPLPPNKVTAGGFAFEYPVRFIGTGGNGGDVPGGVQDTVVFVVYLNSDTAVQKRNKLYTEITAAANALGVPVPARASCAGYYDLILGTL